MVAKELIFIVSLLSVSPWLTSGGGRGREDTRPVLDLPSEHLPYYYSFYPEEEKRCRNDVRCPHRIHLDRNVCWGYEDDCGISGGGSGRMYSHPVCDKDHGGWVKTKEEQLLTFYDQGDFGYVRKVRNSLDVVCKPEHPEDSALECSEHMMFCRGRNIMIDFRNLTNRQAPVLYDTDVLGPGQIGGKCKLNKKVFADVKGPLGSLQSWTPELQHFVELPRRPFANTKTECDMVIERPTFLMKIDATVSYYHHFCDFFNLYLSLHVNATTTYNNPFSRDVNLLVWRTINYESNFGVTYSAFTDHSLLNLNDVRGKRVCFKNVVFPLLPRMIFGLFYNTPLIGGCRKSGIFHAFNRFVLHRLHVKRRLEPENGPLKVTFLSRKTRYRRVLNEDELLNALRSDPYLNVTKAEFTWSTPFVEQLKVMQQTDLLIGMHGAGLTHLLFLPDWAGVFELYNCGDEHCYADLARLRGVHYSTWENTEKLKEFDKDPALKGPQAKHVNYHFNVNEFVRLIDIIVQKVKAEIKASVSSNSRDEL